MSGLLRTSESEVYLCNQDSEQLGTNKKSSVQEPRFKSQCDECYVKSLCLGKIEYQIVLKAQKQKEFTQVQIQEVVEGNNVVTAT